MREREKERKTYQVRFFERIFVHIKTKNKQQQQQQQIFLFIFLFFLFSSQNIPVHKSIPESALQNSKNVVVLLCCFNLP